MQFRRASNGKLLPPSTRQKSKLLHDTRDDAFQAFARAPYLENCTISVSIFT
jgi:hypothetical protein